MQSVNEHLQAQLTAANQEISKQVEQLATVQAAHQQELKLSNDQLQLANNAHQAEKQVLEEKLAAAHKQTGLVAVIGLVLLAGLM